MRKRCAEESKAQRLAEKEKLKEKLRQDRLRRSLELKEMRKQERLRRIEWMKPREDLLCEDNKVSNGEESHNNRCVGLYFT